MSDAELRAKQRAAGGLDERAAHLRARLRAGELSQEHLELAAQLGSDAARAALAEAPPDFDLIRWSVQQGGRPTPLTPVLAPRAALAAAERVAPLCGEPGEANALAAQELREAARAAVAKRGLPEVHRSAGLAEALLIQAQAETPPRSFALRASACAGNAAAGFYGECADGIEAATYALIASGVPAEPAEAEVLAAVGAALIPWLLGEAP